MNEREAFRWNNWSFHDGYNHDPYPSEHINPKTEELPRRGIAPGLHMGLSLLLDVHEDEYYCSGTESIGFKVSNFMRYIQFL